MKKLIRPVIVLGGLLALSACGIPFVNVPIIPGI